ncbi:unnamed protein product [Phytophthora lilii]|uniref:ATP-dependent DNA helicase n=1 Tax=Phytophthora lilii TaxID=2077276 RepID=A0A9W6X5G8_9STRA|nr:unnamed protein product [Phytophthora lilii]
MNEAVVDLEVLIIDDVSMTKKHQLAQLEKSLRAAKRIPSVVFGGNNIVLVGDFLQLPPVGSAPVYQNPS